VDLYLNATEKAVGVGSPFNISLGTVGGVDRGNVEVGTFFRSFKVLDPEKQLVSRVDTQLSQTNNLSVRFLMSRRFSPFGGTVGTSTFEGFDSDEKSHYYNFLISDAHVFSPSVTNELRIAYNRIDLGFPVTDPAGPGGTLPRIVIQLVTELGTNPVFPQGRIANNYVGQDTVTFVSGDHTFRGGIDFLRQISTQAAPYRPRRSSSMPAPVSPHSRTSSTASAGLPAALRATSAAPSTFRRCTARQPSSRTAGKRPKRSLLL
jgi:hypothetical protein